MPTLQSLDQFAKPVTDEKTQTRFGGILTVLVLPLLILAYSSFWWLDFYVWSATWRTSTSEVRLYSNSIKQLQLECSAPGGCYFRLPPGGADTCARDTFTLGAESQDMCSLSSNPNQQGGNAGNGNQQTGGGNGNSPQNGAASSNPPNNNPPNNNPPNNNPPPNGTPPPGRRLLGDDDSTSAGPSCAKVSCGATLSQAEGVCAYIASDPIDALTVAWGSESSSGPQVNFGAKLVTDYKDPADGVIKSKTINLHRGLILLTLVERHDPRMTWEAGHARAGSTSMIEWSVTPVDVTGTLGDSNICNADLSSDGYSSGWQVKLTPFPTYTVERITYPSPLLTFAAAVGGIAGVFFAVLKLPAAANLKLASRKAAAGGDAVVEGRPTWTKDGAASPTESDPASVPDAPAGAPEHV